MSLNTNPYLAVPAYWVLGCSLFQGYTIMRRGEMYEVADVMEEAEVEEIFEADFVRSRRMDAGELSLKPWWFRFAVRLVRLTAPVQ